MRSLFKPTSYRQGAALAVGATALWKAISFGNALLIAAYFGAGEGTDLYFFLLMVIGAGTYFLQRMNNFVIIPQAMALEAKRPLSSRQLLNGFLYVYMALGAVCIALGICCPVVTLRLFSRFSKVCLVTQQSVITWGLILFGLQICSTYQLCVLEMHKRFAAALLSPLNALMPLLFLLCLGPRLGIVSMMYGFVAAQVLQIFLLGRAMKKELDWQLTRGQIWHSAAFTKNLLSNQLIELTVLASGFLPIYLLSGLAAGWVSALNYAKQLSDSANEVLTLRLTNVSKIELTEHAAADNRERFTASYAQMHYLLCFLLTPLTVFSIFYAPQIVTIFFKRGAFTASDVYQTAALLRPLLALMLLTVPVLMQNNVVAAQRKIKEFLPYALLSVVGFIVCVPFTVRAWGALAYPYTQLLCSGFGLWLNAIFLKKYLSWVTLRAPYLDGLRLLSCNILALVPSALFARFMLGENPWIVVFVSGSIFVTALAALTWYSGDLKRFWKVALA